MYAAFYKGHRPDTIIKNSKKNIKGASLRHPLSEKKLSEYKIMNTYFSYLDIEVV